MSYIGGDVAACKKKKLNRLVGFACERRWQFLVIVVLYMSNEKEKKQ